MPSMPQQLDARPVGPVQRPTPAEHTVVPRRQPVSSTPTVVVEQAPVRPEQSGAAAWLLPLGVLVVGMFMSVLDTSIVNVALPRIQLDLGISTADGQWVSTAYSLAEGVMVPISAWLGYRFGGKKIYVLCLAGFTVASVLCGLAGGLGTLVAFRILQAVPGGVIPVTCLTMLREMVPRERFGAAMGLYGLGIVVAPALGPTLGGLLVEYTDWRFIFFVNVPVGVLGLIGAALVLKGEPGRRDRPLDFFGFVTIALGLFALLLAMEEGQDWGWTSYRILILLAAAALMLALFVVIELEVDHPLLDLRVFTRVQFVLPLVLVSAISLGVFAANFFVPQFLQGSVRGLSPVNTGLALIPQALVLAVFLPLAGLMYDRFGSRWLAVLGLLLSSGGLLILSRINVNVPDSTLIIGMVVLAAGVGLGMMPIMSGGLAAAPPEAAGSASSFSTLAQRVSQSLGLGIVTAFLVGTNAQLMADRSGLMGQYASSNPQVVAMQEQGAAGMLGLYQQTTGVVQTDAYSQAFFIIGMICLAGAVLALFLSSGRPAVSSAASMTH